MYRVIIADDEVPARARLRSLFSIYQDFSIIKEADNGDSLFSEMINNKFDLAVLDINMPGKGVFEIIKELENPPIVVFLTAYKEFAFDAYDINATDYLLKPVSNEKFNIMIDKVIERHKNKNKLELLAVEDGSVTKFLETSSIVKLIIENGFCYIYNDKERYISSNTLNYYESLLPANFYRASRDAIINMDYISAIKNCKNGNILIEFQKTEPIEMSRRRVPGFKEILNKNSSIKL